MSFPTSRRSARTLAQAFPREHANAIEHYRRPWFDRLAGPLMAVAIGVVLVFVLLFNR